VKKLCGFAKTGHITYLCNYYSCVLELELSILGGDFENLFRQQDSYFLYFVLCCTCVITSRCNLEVAVKWAQSEEHLKLMQSGSSSWSGRNWGAAAEM